jgi:hypothetical protein
VWKFLVVVKLKEDGWGRCHGRSCGPRLLVREAKRRIASCCFRGRPKGRRGVDELVEGGVEGGDVLE